MIELGMCRKSAVRNKKMEKLSLTKAEVVEMIGDLND